MPNGRAAGFAPLLAVFLLVAWPARAAEPTCRALGPRVECGSRGVTQRSCKSQGCCWDAQPLDLEPWQPDVYLPSCFHPNNGASTYRLEGDLDALMDGTGNATLTNTTSTQPELGPDLPSLALAVEEVSPDIVHLKLTDANTSAPPRWEPPASFFAPGSALAGARNLGGSGPRQFELLFEDDPFSFMVVRVDPQTGEPTGTAFNTSGLRLVFKGQYLELSTWVHPSAHVFGAGERSSQTTYMTRNGYPYSLWNRDQNPQVPMRNTYGSWPWIMVLEQDGSAWGALLHNSNGMDMVATEDRVSWRSLGGVIDLYVLLGPTPLDVVDQLTQVVGRPAMQPYWSFGFHQCKYGYKSVWEVEGIVGNYSAANIPLETIWVDIDHMDEYRVFSFSPEFFPLEVFQRFVAQLHKSGRKWVPILDPGIKTDNVFPPYLDGLKSDVYIKGWDGQDYLGWVWPGACAFPDFGFNPAADAYWLQQLERYNSYAGWDGLWIDMNEIANFCTGDVCSAPSPEAVVNQLGFQQWQCQLQCFDSETGGLSPAQLQIAQPPYAIANSLTAAALNFKAVSPLAFHHGNVLDYDAHNLYGLAESRATFNAITRIKGERPFIITRSSYPGTGAYAGHWTGDNNASWADLQWSIPGIVASGMNGMPMVGSDICGFASNTTEELCTRWIELGAWYPFARDHSDRNTIYQELYRWPSVADAGRRVLNQRMRLLPLFYTVMFNATQTGAPLFRPLFMAFPEDSTTHPISTQLMVGDAILVTPVLQQSATSVEGYFPAALWHNLTGQGVIDTRVGGRNATLDAALGFGAPAHLRGGAIVPMQQAALTTAEVSDSPLTVVVALSDLVTRATSVDGSTADGGSAGTMAEDPIAAAGWMFRDDGVSIQLNTSCCNFLTFAAAVKRDAASNSYNGTLELSFGHPNEAKKCDGTGADSVSWPALRDVQVLGWQRGASSPVVEVLDGSTGAVLLSTPLNDTQVTTDGNALHLDLGDAAAELLCPDGLRITWSSD